MSQALNDALGVVSISGKGDDLPQMQYTRLGRSGLKVSRIILGAMSFGRKDFTEWNLDEEEALPILEYAFKRGINTWDTADYYGQGTSEEIIGKAIKKFNIPRQKVVIMTKCYFFVDPAVIEAKQANDHQRQLMMTMTNDGVGVNQVGLSRKHIFDAVDASVKRLGTYIDIFQIHRLDRDVPPEEIMKALNDVVESGKVRYLGASSMAAWEFQLLNNIAEKHGWHKFISMQNYYNLIQREEEREMIPYCNHAGIGLVPWSPLAGGILARSWSDKTSTLRSCTDEYASLKSNDEDKDVVERLEQVAKRLGKPMAVVATAWCLKKGVQPILGLSKKERIDEALEALALELSDEDVKALEEVYKPMRPAPVW